jgi:hypothetical protein
MLLHTVLFFLSNQKVYTIHTTDISTVPSSATERHNLRRLSIDTDSNKKQKVQRTGYRIVEMWKRLKIYLEAFIKKKKIEAIQAHIFVKIHKNLTS